MNNTLNEPTCHIYHNIDTLPLLDILNYFYKVNTQIGNTLYIILICCEAFIYENIFLRDLFPTGIIIFIITTKLNM